MATVRVGYHFHLMNAYWALFHGNENKARLLVQNFVKKIPVAVLVYTQHSDLLLGTYNGKRCCDSLYMMLQEEAKRHNITTFRGVEVSCVFPDHPEAIHLGVIPYDQSLKTFEWFLQPTTTGLNHFLPYARKGHQQHLFRVAEVFDRFYGKAAIIANHPQLHTAELQRKFVSLIDTYSLPVEWNMNEHLARWVFPSAWWYCGREQFPASSVLGWDIHSTHINKNLTVMTLDSPSVEASEFLPVLAKGNGVFSPFKKTLLGFIRNILYLVLEVINGFKEGVIRKKINRSSTVKKD